MDEARNKNHEKGSVVAGGEGIAPTPLRHDGEATQSVCSKWPIGFILLSAIMAFVRIPLMMNSVKIPWLLYKGIMSFLFFAGACWLLAIDREHRRRSAGIISLIMGILIFTILISGGSDNRPFYPLVFLKGSFFLIILFLAASLILLFSRSTNLLLFAGAASIIFGALHFVGMFFNAAGNPYPASVYIRMNLFFWGGCILFLIGKKLTLKQFFLNLLYLIVSVLLFLGLLIAVISAFA